MGSPQATPKGLATGGRIRQVPLTQAARQAGADFVAGSLESVDTENKVAKTSEADGLEYDALLLAVGATAVPVVPNAMIWRSG